MPQIFILIKKKKPMTLDGLAHIDPHPCRCDPVNYAFTPSNLKS